MFLIELFLENEGIWGLRYKVGDLHLPDFLTDIKNFCFVIRKKRDHYFSKLKFFMTEHIFFAYEVF